MDKAEACRWFRFRYPPDGNQNLIYDYHKVPSYSSTYKSGVEGQIPKGGVGVGEQVERHDGRELREGLLRQPLLGTGIGEKN